MEFLWYRNRTSFFSPPSRRAIMHDTLMVLSRGTLAIVRQQRFLDRLPSVVGGTWARSRHSLLVLGKCLTNISAALPLRISSPRLVSRSHALGCQHMLPHGVLPHLYLCIVLVFRFGSALQFLLRANSRKFSKQTQFLPRTSTPDDHMDCSNTSQLIILPPRVLTRRTHV